YKWLVGELIPCSAPCGNKGLQFPKLKCLRDNSIEVDKSHCKREPQPDIDTVPCNIRDCSPRWIVGSWSRCPQHCGGGIQRRRERNQRIPRPVTGSHVQFGPHQIGGSALATVWDCGWGFNVVTFSVNHRTEPSYLLTNAAVTSGT
ncbi:hypothetical protein scyTo_0020641, partial [Scyliorhinus torazame]|nr:hypothetical protein [Scyliorhinus torazame]